MSTVQARLAVSIIHENHMNAQPETVHWYPQCLLFVVNNYEFQGLSFDFDGKVPLQVEIHRLKGYRPMSVDEWARPGGSIDSGSQA